MAALPPQNRPFPWDIKPPSNTRFPGPTPVHNPNGISIESAVFAGFTITTDRQIDRQTDHTTLCVTNLASSCMVLRWRLVRRLRDTIGCQTG